MRKKSHISLAKHLVNVVDIPDFVKHKKAFYIGSVMPDFKPSFITKRHEITETFTLVEKKMRKLAHGKCDPKEWSSLHYEKLGEIVHYVADYFTFPHNKEYFGNMKEHCIYEGELKHKLRAYIKNLDEKRLKRWKEKMATEELEHFRNVADICEFLKKEHRKYILRNHHSVEKDCKYIVEICSKVVMAILHVCMLTIESKKVYAIVR